MVSLAEFAGMSGSQLTSAAFAQSPSSIWGIAWSPNGDRLATGHFDGSVDIWDATTMTVLQTLEGHTGFVTSLSWKPDGSQLISGGKGSEARVWDTQTGQLVGILPDISSSYVTAATWNSDGTRIFTYGFDASPSSFKIWDAITLQELESDARGDVVQIAWNSVRMQVALANAAGQVLIADADTFESELYLNEPETPEGGVYGVYAVAWSPDGELVAGGNWAGTVRTWDSDTGQNLLNLQATDNSVTDWATTTVHALHFSTNGRYLISITSDGTLRTWDVGTGAIVSTEQLPHCAKMGWTTLLRK